MPNLTLIDFLIKLDKTPGWQRMFRERNENNNWTNLVNRELADPADAKLILDGDQAGIAAKVAQQKTGAHTVWLNATVWT